MLTKGRHVSHLMVCALITRLETDTFGELCVLSHQFARVFRGLLDFPVHRIHCVASGNDVSAVRERADAAAAEVARLDQSFGAEG